MKAYLEITHGKAFLGRLEMDLYADQVPRTVQNFTTLLAQGQYRHSTFHRIIPDFMAQGGDFEHGDGTGGYSIYGKTFADEDLTGLHNRRGTLSMANAGPHTNGSQFFITFRHAIPHLNGKHVVFGHVTPETMAVLDALERNVRTNPTTNRPLQPVVISDCGVIQPPEAATPDATVVEQPVAPPTEQQHKDVADDQDEIELEEDDEEEDNGVPMTKAQQLKVRMRKLKRKMNAARQLNRQAVKEEGERRVAGGHNKKKQASKKSDPQQQSAADALYKAEKTAARAEMNQFKANDYHNPEGQFRNYQNNIKTIQRSGAVASADAATATDTTYNPIDAALKTANPDTERRGARRLAQELHRRYAKRQKRQQDQRVKELMDDEHADHINERNKRFNQKINRTYDKATAEVRQSLERGTAL